MNNISKLMISNTLLTSDGVMKSSRFVICKAPLNRDVILFQTFVYEKKIVQSNKIQLLIIIIVCACCISIKQNCLDYSPDTLLFRWHNLKCVDKSADVTMCFSFDFTNRCSYCPSSSIQRANENPANRELIPGWGDTINLALLPIKWQRARFMHFKFQFNPLRTFKAHLALL